MRAVRVLAWSEIKRRWRGGVALALLVGAIGAIVLATAAGARRSGTALPRFTAFSRSADVSFLPGGLSYTPTPAQLRAVRHLPGVAAVGEVRFFAVNAKGLPEGSGIAAAVDGAEGNEVERPRVVSGRAANPLAADELAVDEPLAAKYHLRIGGHLDLASYTPAEFRVAATGRGGPPPRPTGPAVRLRIVGILRRPLDLGDDAVQGGLLLLTPAFNRTYLDRIGNFGVLLDVRTVHGAPDVKRVTAGVQQIFRSNGGVSPQGATNATQGAGDAINVLTLALWILAGVAALAGIVALAIVLSRELSRVGVDQATLRALGVTRAQRLLAMAPLAGLIGAAGALLAVLGGVALSPLFPVGVARAADPSVGFHADWVVLVAGFVAVIAVVLVIASFAMYRTTGRAALAEPTRSRRRASKVVSAASRAGAPPSVTNGLGMALEAGSGRTAVPVRSAYLGAVLGVLGVTAVFVFSASLDTVVATPARYGANWSFSVADSGFSNSAQDCGSNDLGLTKVEGVDAVAAVCEDGAQVGGRPVVGWGYTPIRGTIDPGITEGHAPQTADEVALGALTLDALHKRVGDTVDARGPHGPVTYRIVGRALFPVFGDAQPLSDGAAFTGAGLSRIFDDNASSNRYLVGRFAPGSAPAVVERRITALAKLDAPGAPTVPIEVQRIHQISWLPVTLAVLLGGLALVAVGHALVTATRRRGRDLALLKTLGFTRRQVHATVAWQATTLAVVGFAVGIPTGLIVGRVLWRLVADGLGVSASPDLPVLALIVSVPCGLVLVNLVASVPAVFAARTRPGVALRSE